jgi:hypothetical protein
VQQCRTGAIRDDGDGEPPEPAPAIRWRSRCFMPRRLSGLARDRLLDDQPEEREESFDADTKMMATFHAQGGGFASRQGRPGGGAGGRNAGRHRRRRRRGAVRRGAEGLGGAGRDAGRRRLPRARLRRTACRQRPTAIPTKTSPCSASWGWRIRPGRRGRCHRTVPQSRHPRHHGHRRPAGDGCGHRRTGGARQGTPAMVGRDLPKLGDGATRACP